MRGLTPFSETEREVFYGREHDTAELSRLVTSDGFRAGLLYGERGVGKTSLLRAGVVPHLRDHGVTALWCDDIRDPIGSFVREIATTTGMAPGHDEQPMQFLARTVAGSVAGQLFLFVLDDVEQDLHDPDEQVTHDLGDLFARVVTRSGGRARFLFCCASQSVHRLVMLERRTGSLFPPSSRYELHRFRVADAATILERTWMLATVSTEPRLPTVVVEALAAESGLVLPADLQITALAVRELGIESIAELDAVGGPTGLCRAWIDACAKQTGDHKAALRLLGELASAPEDTAFLAEWAAVRASAELDFARHALAQLEGNGLLRTAPRQVGPEPHYTLAHPILIPRIREIAAPARAASRRAFELLGAKADHSARLSLREMWALRSEGITPSTPKERALIARTVRFYKFAAVALLAVPVVLIVILYIAMSGRYYLDIVANSGGDRVVVREGRPGLTAFDWLPGSFGSVVADAGLSRPMVDDEAWQRIASHQVTGDLDDYAAGAVAVMDPMLGQLIEYATSGSVEALAELGKAATDPQDLATLLDHLAPIARGGAHEAELVENALNDPSPVVQRSALLVAAAAAMRREGVYQDTLARTLTQADPELRRLALSAVAELGDERAGALYRVALATANLDPEARRELVTALASADSTEVPSPVAAASVLGQAELSAAARERGRNQLRRAFSSDPKRASQAAAKLASDDGAAVEERAFALELLRNLAPEDSYPDIVDQVKAVLDSTSEPIKGAALPLYARIAPEDAARELVQLFENRGSVSKDLRVAMARGWGEVAKTRDRAAPTALEQLLEDESPEVRAAAAEAYGNAGRTAQNKLFKMVQEERFDVAVGAAFGLANSAAAGGVAGMAVGGIAKLWKRKGRPRRAAARAYARLARSKPNSALPYLTSAARTNDDPGLHLIGVVGLCNGTAAGHRKSLRTLARAAGDSSVEVRRVVIQCIVDHRGDTKTASSIAGALAGDVDSEIRGDAARVLASLIAGDKADNADEDVLGPLVRLARDDEREVRLIAIRALASLGESAPEGANEALARAFVRADEAEKLTLIRAAASIGASEQIQQAVGDESPLVRVTALDAALSAGVAAVATMNVALTDGDPGVRRAALERLVANKDRLPQEAIDKALRLATRDVDPTLAQLALITLARVGSSDEVADRLRRSLTERSEGQRKRAAAAAIGLVEREPKQALELLTPLLEDPSHDVRAAMLPALAQAWATTRSPEQLATMLRESEAHAMRRLTTTAAFITLARSRRDEAIAALQKLAADGPPIVRSHAKLGQGLIEGETDGIGFLVLLVP